MNADRDRSEQPATCPPYPHAGSLCGSVRLADAGTTQSAPEPSQTATEAHGDDDGLRVEITSRLNEPTVCKVWHYGRLIFVGTPIATARKAHP